MGVNNELSSIKKAFFCYRNGIISASLRSAGDPHRFIMGCLLPDIAKITQNYRQDTQLANALWAEKNHRECRIAATMLYPIDELDYNTALHWCNDVESKEIADVLCMKLLRQFDEAHKLWLYLINNESEMNQYIGLRLLSNLLTIGKLTMTDGIRKDLGTYAEQATTNGLKLFAQSLINDN